MVGKVLNHLEPVEHLALLVTDQLLIVIAMLEALVSGADQALVVSERAFDRDLGAQAPL